MQGGNQLLFPVAYANSFLGKAGHNYSAMYLEVLVMVWSVKHIELL